jgi:transketolase
VPIAAAPADLARLCVHTIKFLAIDAVEKAKSGHPGLPMGAADLAYVLWSRYLRFDPETPDWPDRDRFVLSAGHGSMLLYALLHLTGYDLTLEDLARFRQWQSRTPGHPEHGLTAGVETTTGPLGQGFGNAVGMAIAARMGEARFNRPDHALFGHRIYCLVSDGDLMEGISHEAASLAGHLGLDNLICLYDDNRITIEGQTSLTFSDDTARRFEGYGWRARAIDGHDHEAIASALDEAIVERGRPSLIIARTRIGDGAPTKEGTANAHGEPLGRDEALATRQALGWPAEPAFHVPEEVRAYWGTVVAERRRERVAWETGFEVWRRTNPDLAALWRTTTARAVPDTLEDDLLSAVGTGDTAATRVHSGKAIQAAAARIPYLAGGAADLDPSTKTRIAGSPAIRRGEFSGRLLHFGVREHAMGAILNGLSLHGTVLPYGGTFLVFSDYMRPPIRLAALMGIPVIFVYTHDSIFVGEDGPTHEPIEQVSSLRLIPNVVLLRPADGPETAMAWAIALRRRTGPTILVLTRQNVPPIARPDPSSVRGTARGGYIVMRSERHRPDAVLIGTGSELQLAVAARAALGARGLDASVVSMPSLELFAAQPHAYQDEVLPPGARMVAIEAGHPAIWHRWVGRRGLVIGIDRFGASAPQAVLGEKLGFTPEAVGARVLDWLIHE